MLPLVSSDRDPIAGSMSALPRLSIENVSFVNVSHPPVVSTHDSGQACAERTYFCEGVVEKLGDLDASTRTSPMHRHAALCRVCGTEAASIRPSGGRFSPSVWDDRPPWRRPWVKQ